jgi:glycosyltransferase involved in cell wall biosynthesis
MSVRNVTVCICNFKQKKWLYRCLKSLANQTLDKDEFEVIVINDDIDEDVSDVTSKMSDLLNIRLFNNQRNMGLPASLNVALENTRGRYFIRVDADDYISKHTLYILSTFLDMNRDYQAIACDYVVVDDIGRVIQKKKSIEEPIACGIMFSYESLCDVGFYNEFFKMREGHELLKRFREKHAIFNMPLPFYRYRRHSANRTLDNEQVKKYDNILEKENE